MPGDVHTAIVAGAKADGRGPYIRPSKSARSLTDFLCRHIRTDRGPFSFAGHKPLKAICEALVADVAATDVQKPTQKGFTTALGFGYTLWEADRNARNVLYFLPTNTLAKDIVKTRFRPAIRDSEIRAGVRDTPSEGLVQVGRAEKAIYFLGLETVVNAISRPSDVNVYDEVDDLDQENLRIARQRLDGSPYAREVGFACGRTPNEGMHARYLAGDQRRWVVTCRRCRHEQIPEDDFPANMALIDEHWRTVCGKCRRPIDFEACGRFVAQKPGVKDRQSFQVSALAFGCQDIDRLMREWHEAQFSRRDLAAFRYSKLGIPDAGDRAALTAETLTRATRPRRAEGAIPHYLGIDVGDVCHWALATPCDVSGALDFAAFGSCPGDRLLECVAAIDGETPLDGILIDQRPEGSLARAICRAYPGRAWLQTFRRSDEKEDEKALDGEIYDRLAMDRDELLEHFCDQVKAGLVWFPETWDGERFASSAPGRQVLAGSQKEERKDGNGLTVLRFRAGAVQNHWFMASAFAFVIARRQSGRMLAVREVRVGGKALAMAELGERKRIGTRIRELFT